MTDTVEKKWVTKAGLTAICWLSLRGYRCGYVKIPEGMAIHGIEARDTNVGFLKDGSGEFNEELTLSCVLEVHGGLSFSGSYNKDIDPDGGWWLGFDCGHYFDDWPGNDFPREEGSVFRSQEYVEEQCEKLAKQIKENFSFGETEAISLECQRLLKKYSGGKFTISLGKKINE